MGFSGVWASLEDPPDTYLKRWAETKVSPNLEMHCPGIAGRRNELRLAHLPLNQQTSGVNVTESLGGG